MSLNTTYAARHATKPGLGAQLDRGHPVSRGLIFCPLFAEGHGAKTFDLASNTAGTLNDATMWASGDRGRVLSFDGSNDWVDYGDTTLFDGATALTILCRFRNRAASWTPTTSFIRKDGTYTPLQSFLGVLAFNIWDGAIRSQQDSRVPALNTWHTYAARWGTTFDSGFPNWWLNGVDQGRFNALANAGTSALVNAANAFRIGATEGGTEQTTGDMDFVYIWNRVVPLAELAAVAAQLFGHVLHAPQQRWVTVAAAAGAPATRRRLLLGVGI